MKGEGEAGGGVVLRRIIAVSMDADIEEAEGSEFCQ